MIRRWTCLAAVATALMSVAPPASAIPADGLLWAWGDDGPRRWFVDNQVVMPQYLFLSADRNKQARLIAFRTRLVISCEPIGMRSRRTTDVVCIIEDLSILGAALRGDKGNLQPILDEMDGKLTGAEVQLGVRDDGRIVHLDVEGIDAETRSEGRTAEAMKVIVGRALAGFDLQLPRKGFSQEGLWAQYQAMLMMAPTDSGTQGSSEIAHLVVGVDDDSGMVSIETAGKGTLSPSTDATIRNYYSTELDAWAEFDPGHGLLMNRVWRAIGTPTASSAIAQGGRGVDYVQQGTLLFLPTGVDAPEVGDTLEMDPPEGTVDSAILPMSPLNRGRR